MKNVNTTGNLALQFSKLKESTCFSINRNYKKDLDNSKRNKQKHKK